MKLTETHPLGRWPTARIAAFVQIAFRRNRSGPPPRVRFRTDPVHHGSTKLTNESMGPGPFDSFGALRPFPCTRARNRAKCTPGRAPQAAPKGVLPGRKSRRCLRWPLGECTSAFSMHACTESREVHSTAARGCGVCPGHKGWTSASTASAPLSRVRFRKFAASCARESRKPLLTNRIVAEYLLSGENDISSP